VSAKGRSAAARPLRLLILGDSAAAGVGADTQDRRWPANSPWRWRRLFSLHWKLLAFTGATTRDILRRLASEPPAAYDVVVTSLGVNDVTGRRSLDTWRRQQLELIDLLRARLGADPHRPQRLPPMHRFPALPQPLRWYVGAARAISTACWRNWRGSGRAATIWNWSHGAMDVSAMASDGFHPGPPIYELWAREAAAADRKIQQGERHDRPLLLDHPQRPQDHPLPRRAGLPYRIVPINIGKGEQFAADFLKISPNNRIPAIVDQAPADGGAPIAVRIRRDPALPRRQDRAVHRADLRGRAETIQWLFWQMGGLGPMAGQNHHFTQYAPEKVPYAIERYTKETARLYAVLNKRLADREFVAGAYSIADMACYPWIVPHSRQGQNLDDFPASQALVRRHPRAAGDKARLCPGRKNQSRAGDHRGREKDTVRPGREQRPTKTKTKERVHEVVAIPRRRQGAFRRSHRRQGAGHEGEMFGEKQASGEEFAVDAIEWLTPTRPSKMIGLWNNFRAAAEKNGNAIPPEPLYFIKGANSYCAHGQPIIAPASHDGRVVYEGELAVVIGKTAKAVSLADAPAHIFGYSCANDVTAPELLKRDESFAQWTRAKSFDTFGVFGPVVETDFDPACGELVTLLNGRERQRYPFPT
jgi:GST-like protein